MWKKSGIFKSIQFKIVNIIAACIFICCVIGVAGGDKTIGTLDDFVVEMTGGEISETGVYTIDASSGIKGNWLTISGFKLTPGVYKYYVDYSLASEDDSNVNSIKLNSIGGNYNELLSNPPLLYSGNSNIECEFFVTVSLDAGISYFTVDYKGTDRFTINDISIVKTTGLYKIVAFFTVLLALILNSAMMLYLYNKKFSLNLEERVVYLGLPIIFLIASMPLFINYTIFGDDFYFHALRIEALADSFKQGIIPARVENRWLYGHGYANSLFYCDTFLTVPAILRVWGFPIRWAYSVYVYMINVLTLLIAYFSFKGIFNDRITAVIGAMLYMLSPYRFYNVYCRSAVGEYTAMVFLPLLCLGFYKIFNDDIKKKEYKYNFFILTCGFSGIIQSHLLTCEMVAGVVIVLCLVNIRKVFRKETFVELVKSVAGMILASLWFLLPMLDMMLSSEYKYGEISNWIIQNRGVYISQILLTIQNGGRGGQFQLNGMYDTGSVYIGLAIILGIILFFVGKRKCEQLDNVHYKLAIKAFVAMIVVAFMSSIYFPWEFLKAKFTALGKIASMLQFPFRLTVIVTMAGCIVAVTGIYWLVKFHKGILKNAVVILVCICSIVFSIYQTNDYLYRQDTWHVYSMANLGDAIVFSGEYLLKDTNDKYKYHDAIPSEGVTVESFEKDYLDTYTYVITGDEDKEYYIELPLILYKGYNAVDINTGESFELCKGDNGHIRVMLPTGYEGAVRVWYSPMWYWHIAEAVSVCFWIAVIVWWGVTKRLHLRTKVKSEISLA